MPRYATIDKTGLVTNVVLWDGPPPADDENEGKHRDPREVSSAWSPAPGEIAVACGPEVGPGWTYAKKKFRPPVQDDQQ